MGRSYMSKVETTKLSDKATVEGNREERIKDAA